jgi:hypothetical protein
MAGLLLTALLSAGVLAAESRPKALVLAWDDGGGFDGFTGKNNLAWGPFDDVFQQKGLALDNAGYLRFRCLRLSAGEASACRPRHSCAMPPVT